MTGTSVTIDYLAERINDVLGVQVEKNYKDLLPGDPEQSDGTTNKMQKLLSLNLNDLVPLKEGLKNTIQYIKNLG